MSKLIDKLAWLRIENHKALCVRSKGKQLFYIPGGKRDPGESDQQALCREIQEELSVALEPASLSLFGTFIDQADGKDDGTQVQITCYQADYQGELAVDSEIEELAWLGYGDLPRCSLVVKQLFEHLYREGLIR
ncbi:NUDIX hydrolase [Aliagarivorans marinus]|uniref:NUDIX hydrolase n=1 Tax=Aliagarivorans marinus TaxID=561965 RepID=UPI000412B3F1|nr:NUDIX domain-containing protein [Aliagarivorans marinus]